jgi:hypothetical protein
VAVEFRGWTAAEIVGGSADQGMVDKDQNTL